jgi:hypothetical protein
MQKCSWEAVISAACTVCSLIKGPPATIAISSETRGQHCRITYARYCVNCEANLSDTESVEGRTIFHIERAWPWRPMAKGLTIKIKSVHKCFQSRYGLVDKENRSCSPEESQVYRKWQVRKNVLLWLTAVKTVKQRSRGSPLHLPQSLLPSDRVLQMSHCRNIKLSYNGS